MAAQHLSSALSFRTLSTESGSAISDMDTLRRWIVVVVRRGISSKTDGRTKAEGLSFYHPGHQTAWVRC